MPGVTDCETIEARVSGPHGPLTTFATSGVPPPTELEALGVARISVGGCPYQACLALLDDVARELNERGGSGRMFKDLMPSDDAQLLLARHGARAR